MAKRDAAKDKGRSRPEDARGDEPEEPSAERRERDFVLDLLATTAFYLLILIVLILLLDVI